MIKMTMLLRPFFILKRHYISKGTMVLSTLLILKGHKRKGRWGLEMHRAERGRKKERFIGNSIKNLVCFEVREKCSLYRSGDNNSYKFDSQDRLIVRKSTL